MSDSARPVQRGTRGRRSYAERRVDHQSCVDRGARRWRQHLGILGIESRRCRTDTSTNELGPNGIRVNAIAPGIIDTPGVQDQMEPLRAGGLDIDARIAANPVGKAGQPDHIARAALSLAGDLAEFVSGHVLVVDGGSTA